MTNRSALYHLVQLRRIIDLRRDSDPQKTVERIRGNIQLEGFTLWILICAVMLASIGLDTGSTAVIIGAMLISPLMDPILGIGLSLAIHDRQMLLSALRNFGLSIAISLATATIYFLVTPLGLPTTELLSRTTPTLLDVGIAFFGGVAGIVAGSRKKATNAIPGVAIATALMPPLCTAGFGIAVGRWDYFLGAFYLFFINAVFISLSTFLVVRILRIPDAKYVDSIRRKRVRRWMLLFIIATLIPSIIIFYNVVQDVRLRQAASRFVERFIDNTQHQALRWELKQESGDTLSTLKIYLVGKQIPSIEIDSLQQLLPINGLPDVHLYIVQAQLPPVERAKIDPEELIMLLQNAENKNKLEQSGLILDATQHSQPTMNDSIPIHSLYNEIRTFVPQLDSIAYVPMLYQGSGRDSTPTFIIGFNQNSRKLERNKIIEQIEYFLRSRLDLDSVRLITRLTLVE